MKTPSRILLSALGIALFCGLWLPQAALAQNPKAVVITGWNENAKDKEWHDKIAEEAKKDLEAAGYDVEVITEADKDKAKEKITDANTKVLVVIDHGATGEQKVGFKSSGGALETLLGSDVTGPFNNIQVATIHACDQNQQSWKDKFPNADFHTWTGCVYPSTELEWQKKKEYAPAQTPQTLQTSIETHPFLLDGKFLEEGTTGILFPENPLSGNWQMSSALAAAFGSLDYNFFVTDDDLTNPDLIFGASVIGGIIFDHLPGESVVDPDFTIAMTHSLYLSAIMDPFLLLGPGLLGTSVFIDDLTPAGTLDENVLFAGVRRNLFRVQQVSEPATFGLILAICLLIVGLRSGDRRTHNHRA